jgi:regulator of RNase E activity RraA
MHMWQSESFGLFVNEALHKLFPALVGDVMDKMGYLHQFLPATIKPLHPDMIVFGKAMPVLEADVFSETWPGAANGQLNKPFGLMFEALDDLKQDEVYICTGSSLRYALWGGLMSIRAMKLMAAGCVLHGYSRDTREILRHGFPTFSMGTYGQDQGPRGKVIDYRVPIEIEGVRIHPGDVVYVPAGISEEVFSKAIEKARGEQLVAKALSEGMSTVSAFQQFGIM